MDPRQYPKSPDGASAPEENIEAGTLLGGGDPEWLPESAFAAGTLSSRSGALAAQFVNAMDLEAQSAAAQKVKRTFVRGCAIPALASPLEFLELPLVRKQMITADTGLFTFKLLAKRPVKFPTCASVSLRGANSKGETLVKTYVPVSEGVGKKLGEFTLCVKNYNNGGLSQWIHGLEPPLKDEETKKTLLDEDGKPVKGDCAGFSFTEENVQVQYPFNAKKITMVCTGTGITPMFQAIKKIVETPGDMTEVVLIYGSKTIDDIILKAQLDAMVTKSEGRVNIVYCVGKMPGQRRIVGWDGEIGWLDAPKIHKHAFKGGEGSRAFVCGIPQLYDMMCGPQSSPVLKPESILHKLGYTTETVFKH